MKVDILLVVMVCVIVNVNLFFIIWRLYKVESNLLYVKYLLDMLHIKLEKN